MSIRLRIVDGEHIAICAAYSEAKDGDVYLHDGWHYALACKFMRDEAYMSPDSDLESDEINDAVARKECKCPSCEVNL